MRPKRKGPSGGTLCLEPPDRLSVNSKSRHYDEHLLSRQVGIRCNGKERNIVEEYRVSEGWIAVPAGRALDRRGNPMTIKLKGSVEPCFRDAAPADAG